MKAIKVKTVSSQIKRSSTKVSFAAKETSATGTPTPKDFDRFIPWICLQFQASRVVTVHRLIREEYRPSHKKSSNKSKLKVNEKKQGNTETGLKKYSSDSFASTSSSDITNAIPLTAYYNTKGYLVEVAFINSPCQINRKVIRAINLCLPFHPLFYKLTISGRGLTQTVLNEISKLLPYSNITDICLDDTYVAEGNYHVILEKESPLQNVSLCRCRIDDELCKNLVSKLEYGAPASKCISVLDLTSNQITDVGAQAVGRMLKRNRKLLHLGLADNKLTDSGAIHIFNQLVLFPLSEDDLFDLKHRYFKYCFNKIDVNRQCEREVINRLKEEEEKENRTQRKRLTEIPREDKKNQALIKRLTELPKLGKDLPLPVRRMTETSKPSSAKKLKKSEPSLFFKEQYIIEQAEKMTKEIVGDFVHIFDDHNVRYKRGQIYSVGNLKLCSLNLAYNNLSYISVRKVHDVLKYQRDLCKPPQCKGLLRIVLDGNNIPKTCAELEAIGSYLDLAVTENISISELSRSASTLRSFRKFVKK